MSTSPLPRRPRGRRPLVAALAGVLLVLGSAAAATPADDETEAEPSQEAPATTEPPVEDPPATDPTDPAEDATDASEDADIAPDADAALAVVVPVNGVEHPEAPGARVATGSTVEWTYELSNTGDVDLVLVAASDAWSAGDGTSGETDVDLGYDPEDPGLPLPIDPRGLVLEPGDTWIAAASAAAVEGQFTSTLTVEADPVTDDGTALDLEVEGGTATSAYLAGVAGLSVTTTLDGVATSGPPGVGVAVGAPLAWSYTVTNTGTVELAEVALLAVGGTGGAQESIGTGTAPALAPGEQVTLSASGTTQAGQHAATATVTASTPDGGTVSAADDS